MNGRVNHVIQFEEPEEREGDRVHWECDCGTAGSAPSDRVDLAAERHVREGEPVSYRYRAR